MWDKIVTYFKTEFPGDLASFATNFGAKVLAAIVILIVGFKLSSVISKRIRGRAEKSRIDTGVLHFIGTFVGVALKVLVFVIVCGIVGVPTATLITVLGTAGVAIGLALQGSLSNIAGGLLILGTKPFHEGDFIDTGSYSGTVTDIGMFYTTLTTPDNRKIVLPNSSVSSAALTNYSANPTRRLDCTFTVDYASDLDTVKRVLGEVIAADPRALRDPAPQIVLTEHADSALVFSCRVWVNSGDYWGLKFDLNEAVKKAFDANHISIPFPQMDVHVNP